MCVFCAGGRIRCNGWGALSFVGVLWLVSRGEPLALRENGIAPGDRLALVNVVIYAGYSLALRRAPPVHWASLLWAMCAAATLVSVPFYAAELWVRGFHLPPWQGWLLLVYVALFVSMVSKLFYMEGVLAIGAGAGGADDEFAAGVWRAGWRRGVCR